MERGNHRSDVRHMRESRVIHCDSPRRACVCSEAASYYLLNFGVGFLILLRASPRGGEVSAQSPHIVDSRRYPPMSPGENWGNMRTPVVVMGLVVTVGVTQLHSQARGAP